MNLKIIGTGLLLICGLSVSAQEKNDSNEVGNVPGGMGKPKPEAIASDQTKTDKHEIYRAVQKTPEPKFNSSNYFSKNLRYPEAAKKNKIQGKIVVQFVVEIDGSLSSATIIRGRELGHGLPEEAIRAVLAMPEWKPAVQSGKFVRAYYTLPVVFKLP
ncbi:MAG: energy transducer TonB [Taibaiella sp.]|nr:energy transducer TonB [Taibaiella sp.]